MLDGGDASALQATRVSFVVIRAPLLARIARIACIVCAASLVSSRGASGAPRVHLRGMARIDAHAARSQGKLVLRGSVTDDMGVAVEHVRVTVHLSPASVEPLAASLSSASSASSAASAASAAPETCGDVAEAPSLDGVDRWVVPTDASARFCVRLGVPAGRYVAHLEARESGFVDSARLDLPVDSALEAVTLRFDPEQPFVSLDESEIPIEVTASTEDDGVVAAAARLPLTLSNEAGTTLGTATTNETGHAQFVVPGALFGPAGPGELRVSFAGSANAGASSHARAVERRALVVLEAPDAIAGRLALAPSEADTFLRVVAKAACASRGCVGVPTGTIEVGLGDGDPSGRVGAATLQRGEARVGAALGVPAEPGAELPLEVRYLPDAPWFEPVRPLLLTQPLRPPSAWNKIALALAGLAVAGWIGIARLPRRSESRAPDARGRRKGEPSAETVARVEMVRPDAAGKGGWTGKVFDSHEHGPLPGVRVAVERPGFEHAEALGEAISDEAGLFVLAPIEARPGDVLVAEGPLHARMRQPVPPHGEIRVALVARRRALLDRLVAWARRRGRPFDARPDPTPAHVSRMARSGDVVKEWAEAVERAAYSGAAVDAEREAEVDRLAPPDASPTRDSK
jgi:hypothetical protein